MNENMRQIRVAVRAADMAAATMTPAVTGASEAVFIGDVTTVTGEVLSLYRTPNGSLLAYGNRGTALALDPGEFERLREVLGRAVMPGQGD